MKPKMSLNQHSTNCHSLNRRVTPVFYTDCSTVGWKREWPNPRLPSLTLWVLPILEFWIAMTLILDFCHECSRNKSTGRQRLDCPSLRTLILQLAGLTLAVKSAEDMGNQPVLMAHLIRHISNDWLCNPNPDSDDDHKVPFNPSN